MADKSFTFFELHFHDGFQFGPKSLEGLGGPGETGANDGADGESALDAGDETAREDPDDGGCLGCKLVGIGVLAAAAYAARKLLGGPNGLDALDDIEELDEFGSGDERSDGADDAEGPDDAEDDAVAIEVTSDDESGGGGNAGLLVAAAVTLLVLLALAAKKLLGGDVETIELPDELAEE